MSTTGPLDRRTDNEQAHPCDGTLCRRAATKQQAKAAVGLAIAGQPSAQSSTGDAHRLSLAHLWIRGEMLSMNGTFARE
jgi:ABC-type transport system involved in cytochrome c biogenesis ATPase subunit